MHTEEQDVTIEVLKEQLEEYVERDMLDKENQDGGT